ncbi:MAG: Gfo/Idh/MocA family oxidoreductase [Spirochaetaceae bacterium]|jgi:predicted dehydrogenase|nr:Gfo/Idh/MocA family oxidoreductase [Spirochaetaceae bacterium]
MRFLFVGFRHVHIESLYETVASRKDLEVAACVESDPSARKSAAEKLHIAFSESPYTDLISNDVVDIVAVGSCYGDRARVIKAALYAGMHVLSDKPICVSFDELRDIKELARSKHRKVGCLFDLRYLPQVKRAKAILQSGRLGEVRNVSFTGQHFLDAKNRPSWYYEPGMHGGTINDLGVHGVDLVRHLTGLRVKTVDAARCRNAYATEHPDFRDCAVFMARLSNGADLLADVSYSAPEQAMTMPTYWNFTFWCERGMLRFCAADLRVYVYEAGESDVQVFQGIDDGTNVIDDFLFEIKAGADDLTEGVFAATYDALLLQAAADGGAP